MNILLRRNADRRIAYVPASGTSSFDNQYPTMTIRDGDNVVMVLSLTPTVNGSGFTRLDGSLVLNLYRADVAVLSSGVPSLDTKLLNYGLEFTDVGGLNSYIVGGDVAILGINTPTQCAPCAGGGAEILVSLDSTVVSVNIETSTVGVIGEAPIDGRTYGRRDATWVEVVGGGSGIPDAPSDGSMYAREDGSWVSFSIPPVVPVPFTIGANVSPPLTDGEVLFYYTMAESVSFPAGFAGSEGSVSVNPSTPMLYYLRLNGAAICTVTVSVAGVVSFSGAAVTVNAGDVLSFIAQPTPDTDCVCGITFKGARV